METKPVSHLVPCVCSFPNKMVLGRTHVKEVAMKRKLELNSYVHNLLSSASEVTEVPTRAHTHTHTQCVCG